MPLQLINPLTVPVGADDPSADWIQFLLADADGSADPNSVIVTAAEDGDITQFSIAALAARSKVNEGAIWYIQTDLVAGDAFCFNGAIEFTDVAGDHATAETDEMIVWMGLTSDPANMATRAIGVGYEHGLAADPRACGVQGSGVIQYGGSPPNGRHQMSNILSLAGHVGTASRSELIGSNMAPSGSQINQGFVAAASNADPIYIFVCIGSTALAAYTLNCRFFYSLTKAITPF